MLQGRVGGAPENNYFSFPKLGKAMGLAMVARPIAPSLAAAALGNNYFSFSGMGKAMGLAMVARPIAPGHIRPAGRPADKGCGAMGLATLARPIAMRGKAIRPQLLR